MSLFEQFEHIRRHYTFFDLISAKRELGSNGSLASQAQAQRAHESIYLITLTPNLADLQYTAYFYCKKENMILPLLLPNDSTDQIITVQSGKILPRPLVYDTIRRVINALGGSITGILIDRYKDDLYYAYIRVKKNNLFYDIDCGLTDALCLALITGVKIDVNKEILNEYGIKVTKELLDKALNN